MYRHMDSQSDATADSGRLTTDDRHGPLASMNNPISASLVSDEIAVKSFVAVDCTALLTVELMLSDATERK